MAEDASDNGLFRPAFVLAMLAHFGYALSLHLFLHVPGFIKGIGASEVQIGWIFGMTGATAIAARPFFGRAMDRRGVRIVILTGGVLNTLVCASYLTVHAMGAGIYAVRIAHGISEAMLFASLFAYAADIIPASRRIEGIALFGVSGMVPLGLGGLVGDLLLHGGGYSRLFVTATACSGAALLLSLPLRNPSRAEGEPPRGLLRAVTQRDLLPLWFIGTVFATALAANYAFLKTFVLARGFGSVGVFFGCYAAAAVALRIGLGSLPERVGPKRVLLPAIASLALGLLLLGRASASRDVAAAGVLCGIGHGYTFPILLGLVVARARASERGAALAIFTALFDLGMLIGAPALGTILDVAGYSAMFITASTLVAAGGVAFAIWDAPAGRAHDPSTA